MKAETIIRGLTICSLSGLLLAVGLRLTIHEVVRSLQKCHLALIIAVNFIAVPALVVVATRLLGFNAELSIGMILLSAAPFAPVVPVFTRMARADLALAAGLTSLFPLLCVFLTPFVVKFALVGMPGAEDLHFNIWAILVSLLATIVLPLGLGMTIRHFAPSVGRKGLRPIEIISEFTGALSLAYVTFTERSLILSTGWLAVLVMVLLCEASLLLGYAVGGPGPRSRQVVGLGTSNRNIALALLVALESFGGTKVVATVVDNGLLLILCGLVHVGFWRFFANRAHRASE
jgi:BASS family bile acid:Na+ symporter